MSLHIKRPWLTVLSTVLLGSSLFWRLVGRASDVDFLIDAGKWIGPRTMGFLVSWGWVLLAALAALALYMSLREPSVKKATAEETATGQEKPEVPERLPGEEKIPIPVEPSPGAFGRPGTGITVHGSPGAVLRGNLVHDCDHGIDVGSSPEAELWDNLVFGIGPRRKDVERERGSKRRRKKDR